MNCENLEENKHNYADYLSSALKSYPEIISDSLRSKSIMINPNDVFICIKLLENYKLQVSAYNKGLLSTTGSILETKHTFSKIKEGLGDFSGWYDYQGIDKNSIILAADYAEKQSRSALTKFIGGDGQIQGVSLKNDDFNFDVSLDNEFKSDYDIRNTDLKELTKELTQISKSIKQKSKGRIRRVFSDLVSDLQISMTGNSAGGLNYQKIPRTSVVFTTIAYPERIIEPNGLIGRKSFRIGGACGLELFHDLLDSKYINKEDLINNIVNESIDYFYNSMLIEKTCYKPYRGINAILDPGSSGTFVHEALGHHVEQDLEDDYFGARFLRDSIGDKVSSDNLSVYFNPMYNKNQTYRPYGSYFYDDECTKARDTIIIKNGIAVDTLTDLAYANIYNIEPNGHSIKDHIRMSNLIIDDKFGVNPEHLFEDIKGKGFFIKNTHGGYTNEINKQARVFVDSMYFINSDMEIIPIATLVPASSKKRKEKAIVSFNLSIDSFDILHKTVAIGKDQKLFGDKLYMKMLSASHCGKEGEVSPTAEGGAYLLFEDLLLTKNELDAPRKCLFM